MPRLLTTPWNCSTFHALCRLDLRPFCSSYLDIMRGLSGICIDLSLATEQSHLGHY